MRILIVDDAIAGSKELRSLFGGGKKSNGRATAGAPEIGKLLVARTAKKGAAKKAGKKTQGRAGASQPGSSHLDLGDQPEQTSAIADALGIALLNRGLSDEGAALIELGLKIRRKFYGPDHPTTALSLNSYSRVLRQQGDYAGATDIANDALRINRTVFGEAGYPVAASLLELALVQLLEGLLSEAIASAQEGLNILRALNLYETDPNTTRLLDVIGRAQGLLEQLDEAEETYKTLLPLDQKQLGTRKHPKYACHLANYGLVLESQKKRGAAAKAYRNAIDLYTQSLNIDYQPNLIDLYANLGSLLRTPPAKLKEAGEYLEKALALGIELRGEKHPLTGNDHANLGRWHYDNDDRSSATKSFTKALDIYEHNVSDGSLPADHFFIAESLTWKGRIAVERDTQAGGAEAEPLLTKAREIWPAQLGPNTVGQAMATGYLGRALALRGVAATTESCRLLCEGYRELKANPQSSTAVIEQFEQWIEEQGCECGESAAAK